MSLASSFSAIFCSSSSLGSSSLVFSAGSFAAIIAALWASIAFWVACFARSEVAAEPAAVTGSINEPGNNVSTVFSTPPATSPLAKLVTAFADCPIPTGQTVSKPVSRAPHPSPFAACAIVFAVPYTGKHTAFSAAFPTLPQNCCGLKFPIIIYTPLASRQINQ